MTRAVLRHRGGGNFFRKFLENRGRKASGWRESFANRPDFLRIYLLHVSTNKEETSSLPIQPEELRKTRSTMKLRPLPVSNDLERWLRSSSNECGGHIFGKKKKKRNTTVAREQRRKIDESRRNEFQVRLTNCYVASANNFQGVCSLRRSSTRLCVNWFVRREKRKRKTKREGEKAFAIVSDRIVASLLQGETVSKITASQRIARYFVRAARWRSINDENTRDGERFTFDFTASTVGHRATFVLRFVPRTFLARERKRESNYATQRLIDIPVEYRSKGRTSRYTHTHTHIYTRRSPRKPQPKHTVGEIGRVRVCGFLRYQRVGGTRGQLKGDSKASIYRPAKREQTVESRGRACSKVSVENSLRLAGE